MREKQSLHYHVTANSHGRLADIELNNQSARLTSDIRKKKHDLTITATPVASKGEIQTPEQTKHASSVTTINTVRN